MKKKCFHIKVNNVIMRKLCMKYRCAYLYLVKIVGNGEEVEIREN